MSPKFPPALITIEFKVGPLLAPVKSFNLALDKVIHTLCHTLYISTFEWTKSRHTRIYAEKERQTKRESKGKERKGKRGREERGGGVKLEEKEEDREGKRGREEERGSEVEGEVGRERREEGERRGEGK